MYTCKFSDKTRLIPSTWNELTRQQLLCICRHFTMQLSAPEFKLRILFFMLKTKWRLFSRIAEDHLYFAGEKLNFLLDQVTLTKNLMPVLRPCLLRLHPYYGPQDGMLNCSFEEFINAQILFTAWLKEQTDPTLCQLIACLYRPQKTLWLLRKRFSKSSDRRVAFSKNKLVRRSRHFRRLDLRQKLAVKLFITGVFNSLPSQFPNVFRVKGDAGSGGWPALVISLADGRSDDQSLEKVLGSNMYNVLLSLEQKAIAYYQFLEKTKP